MNYSVDNLFVSFIYGDISIDGTIFDNIEDAINEANLLNDNYSKLPFGNGDRPYQAISLGEAIEKIRDYVIYGKEEYQIRNFR